MCMLVIGICYGSSGVRLPMLDFPNKYMLVVIGNYAHSRSLLFALFEAGSLVFVDVDVLGGVLALRNRLIL